MRPTELEKCLIARFKAGIKRPLFIVSSPGLGKNQILAQTAKKLKVALKAVHGPIMQPEEYGFPVVSADKDNVTWVVSRDKFPIQGSDCPEEGILFIDELPQTDTAGQKIIANLIQEREIHGQHLKDGWMIVCAGNRTSDRAGANRLLSHLKDRVTEVELQVHLEDWIEWAIPNEVPQQIVSFLRYRPNLLNAFDPQQENSPTPRSWAEGVAKSMKVVEPALELEMFKGDIGEAAASEFVTFMKIYRDLPDLDELLKNPTKAALPTDPAVRYALTGALNAKTTSQNFGQVMAFVERMPSEFTVLYLRQASRQLPEIATQPAFVSWLKVKGKDLLNVG